jgi:hypothetical protein
MEIINFNNSSFKTKKMIPENGNELTFLWGRQLVYNFINSYGMIGTLAFGVPDGVVAYNLNLTKVFSTPPQLYLYARPTSSSGLTLISNRWNEVNDVFESYIVNDVLYIRHTHTFPNNGFLYYRLVAY